MESLDRSAAHSCRVVPFSLLPMLAEPGVGLPRDGANWAAEYKWTGVRALCFIRDGQVRITSRHGNDVTHKYPELRSLPDALNGRNAVLDGQVVALDSDYHSDAFRLQHRLRAARLWETTPIAYVLFDVLEMDDHPMLGDAYAYRRLVLEQLNLNGPAWRTPPCFYGDHRDILDAARCLNLDGVVLKRLDSPYAPGVRSDLWLSLPVAPPQTMALPAARVPRTGWRSSAFG